MKHVTALFTAALLLATSAHTSAADATACEKAFVRPNDLDGESDHL